MAYMSYSFFILLVTAVIDLFDGEKVLQFGKNKFIKVF